MSFEEKLITFCILIYIAIWLSHKYPNASLSKLASSWHGPIPRKNERLSSFLLRQSTHAFSWVLQIAFIITGLLLLELWLPELNQSNFYIASIFSTFLLGGTFLLATLVYFFQAIKQRWIGPNPLVLEPEDEDPVEK